MKLFRYFRLHRLTVRERLETDLREAQEERVKFERGLEEYTFWLAMLNSRIARITSALDTLKPATGNNVTAIPSLVPNPNKDN